MADTRYQVGQSGNPNGTSRGKPFSVALERVLLQFEDESLGVKRGQAIRKLAEQLLMQALAGDLASQREIIDRLQGKAHQSVDVSGEVLLSYEQQIQQLAANAAKALPEVLPQVFDGELIEDKKE